MLERRLIELVVLLLLGRVWSVELGVVLLLLLREILIAVMDHLVVLSDGFKVLSVGSGLLVEEHGYSVDFGVVLVELIELDGVGAVLVDEVEAEPDLFVGDDEGGAAEFLEEEGELVDVETALLLIEIIEYFPERQSVLGDNFI